jgi:glycosyltransferase involved in cell wall biosynthesis
MRIAIQAADLDAPRIDGTRVYIWNLLKYFGKIDSSSDFLIYHKDQFNPQLTPADFPNYKITAKTLPCLWTQIRFAGMLWKDRPDILWMPMHNMPIIRRKNMKTVATIHDLAFKYFPETFTKKDLFKINLLTKVAVNFADKIITVSQSSKRDILKFYPEVKEENIRVIYHGFDAEVFEKERDLKKEEDVKKKYNINGPYIIYIGAIQPRKNLETLIEAFNIIKSKASSGTDNLNLVLAGERAWLSDTVFEKIEASPHQKDIKATGKVSFDDLGHLLRGTQVFVFPSLYEGFGIPVLESFASRVPVICANNSSLPEVGGEAALYFEEKDPNDLAEKINQILSSEMLRNELIAKGQEQIKKFSWEKCAQETLEYLKG